uniref:DNA-directed RNA polymerase III subunit n=1 Tax=Sander lucioperca TaxID=283035 RepID=A0A8C9ZJU3_SANLU
MAGRGGGRGRRMMTFSVEAVGITRGDSLPPSIQQPTPLFPVMEQKPLPLTAGEEEEYLLALKQEFRGAMKSLPCFIQPTAAHRGQSSTHTHTHTHTQTSLTYTHTQTHTHFSFRFYYYYYYFTCFLCQTLQKKEEGQSSEDEEEEGEEKKKKQEEEEAEGEEEYDEEEFEEETDYVMSYFDNGEEFGGDSDDNMDEAIY